MKDAKNKWIKDQCEVVNLQFGTKNAWASLKILKAGLSKTKPTTTKQMNHPDGSICKTPEEKWNCFFYNHVKTLYGRSPTFDNNVLDMLPQNPIVEGCDHVQNDEEIRLANLRLRTRPQETTGSAPGMEMSFRMRGNIWHVERSCSTVLENWGSPWSMEDWSIDSSTKGGWLKLTKEL